jgi:hypothetical protein
MFAPQKLQLVLKMELIFAIRKNVAYENIVFLENHVQSGHDLYTLSSHYL